MNLRLSSTPGWPGCRGFVSAAAVLLVLLLTSSATGQEVREGFVRDALTESPVEGATIRIGDRIVTTDQDGHYAIELPDEPYVLELFATYPDGQSEVMRQALEPGPEPAQPRITYVFTEAYLDLAPMVADPVGLPLDVARSQPPANDEGGVDLMEFWLERHAGDLANPLAATLPEVLPSSIRVGRRDASTCSGNPILRTETVDLETYAAGVVTAEIGVFRALTTGEATQFEGFKTFAIAAVSYALWFWVNGPDDTYHLDDTACNQRYISGPYPEIITRAAAETVDEILIRRGTTATIDKFEYAASCGRNGTLPEYRESTVPDVTGGNACTGGGWCGHNDCAGHQDNPSLPGSDRCLVRGICQWGTAERSARGDTYTEILANYQPELEVRDFGAPPATRLLGFVRQDSITDGAGIASATVRLDTGETTTTNGEGYFAFEAATPGMRMVTYTAAGYDLFSQEKEVVEGIDNWASAALTVAVAVADPDDSPDMGREDSGVPDTGASDVAASDLGGSDLGRVDTRADTRSPDSQSDLVIDRSSDTTTGRDNGDSFAHPLTARFSEVGPEGLGDTGCGCQATGSAPPFPAIAFFSFAAWAALSRRRRLFREPRP